MFTGPPAFVLIHVTTLTASALSDHGVSDLWVPCRITQRCARVSRLIETSGVPSDFMIALLARPPAADILKQLENARGSKKANCDSRGLSLFDAAYRWSAGPPLRFSDETHRSNREAACESGFDKTRNTLLHGFPAVQFFQVTRCSLVTQRRWALRCLA